MFCDRCGTQLQPGYNLCPKCGKVIGETLSFPAQSRLGRHLHTLGILWIVVGAFWLIPSIVLMTLGSVVHIAIPGTEAVASGLGSAAASTLGTYCRDRLGYPGIVPSAVWHCFGDIHTLGPAGG